MKNTLAIRIMRGSYFLFLALGALFAAISIVIDKPFVVGDAISVENYRGKVEHIGLKTTRVRSESGEMIIFSNGELLKSKIRNYSRWRRLASSWMSTLPLS